MNKLAIFFADGYEEIEALTVVDICRRCGLEIDMVAVEEVDKVTGSHGISVEMDKMLSQIDFDAYDMLILPGGMPGTKNLEACEKLMEQVDAFDAQGKYIAAICAAPSIFGHRGLVDGRSACCYPGFESHLTGANATENMVEISDHVITSRGMGTAIPFALAIVSVFLGEEKAKEMGKSIIYC